MNISPKYIAAFVLGFACILGWNAFLIVRDFNLFEAQKQQICKYQFNQSCIK